MGVWMVVWMVRRPRGIQPGGHPVTKLKRSKILGDESNFFLENVDFLQDKKGDLPCPRHPRTSLALAIQEPLHATDQIADQQFDLTRAAR